MPELGGVPIREEEPVARHLPLRACPGAFEAWAEVDDEAQLTALIKAARAEKRAIRPVPPLSDALPPEGGLTGLALRLGRGFEAIEAAEGGLRVGASVPLALVGLRRGYDGLAGAPGTLADAWEEGWIAPAVARIRRFRGRSFEELDEAAPDPKTLLVSAVLRPGVKLHPPRAGQAFKPVKKRELADLLRGHGLAGLRLGGAALAEPCPEVLVNRGDASPKQIRLLLQAARERVHNATGIELEDRLSPPGRGGRL